MFTGIIQAVGEIAAMDYHQGDLRLRVLTRKLDLDDVALGDSIANNGVCLTVTELSGDGFWADVSVETLNFSTLGSLCVGDGINLEKAVAANARLGGHIVSGHIDGVGEIVARADDARSVRFTLKAPDNLAKYIAKKGSICVDGTSLTINAVSGADFDINVIPQTLQETVFGTYKLGSKVNIEVDVIARYLERLLLGEKAAEPSVKEISIDFLREYGFARGVSPE